MPNKKTYKVLVLCTGNSARSVIAEYILRAKGKGRFDVSSAGSKPSGTVNPFAVWVLDDRYGLDARKARSKSWDEFKAVKFDIVITVCDHARESCPIWPGQPVIAHWSSPDPAGYEGPDDKKKQYFVQVASQIAQRVSLLCAFPDDKMESLEIGSIGGRFALDNEGDLPR